MREITLEKIKEDIEKIDKYPNLIKAFNSVDCIQWLIDKVEELEVIANQDLLPETLDSVADKKEIQRLENENKELKTKVENSVDCYYDLDEYKEENESLKAKIEELEKENREWRTADSKVVENLRPLIEENTRLKELIPPTSEMTAFQAVIAQNHRLKEENEKLKKCGEVAKNYFCLFVDRENASSKVLAYCQEFDDALKELEEES